MAQYTNSMNHLDNRSTKALPMVPASSHKVPPASASASMSASSLPIQAATTASDAHLQIIDESFEDVTLNQDLENYLHKSVSASPPKKTRPRSYNNKQQQGSCSTIAVPTHQSQPHSQPQPQQQQQQQLTPSQRYRIRRKQLNHDLEFSLRHPTANTTTKYNSTTTIPTTTNAAAAAARTKEIIEDSLSDDELPDNYIVYNVPVSKSLKALWNREQFIMNQPFMNNYPSTTSIASAPPTVPNSATTTTTDSRSSSLLSHSNRSSVFSYSSNISSVTNENLSMDAKFLTMEMNKDIELIHSEESQQRIYYLKKMMSCNSRDSIISNNSTTAMVLSDTTEKYLSNTRPTNLPPKDKYESLKHSKDYEALLTSAMKLENDRCNSQQEFLKKNSRQQAADLANWNQIISSNFTENLSKTSTRELWWRGIPEQLRSKIWVKQIGNKLDIKTSKAIELFNSITSEQQQKLSNKIVLHCFPNLSYAADHVDLIARIVWSYGKFNAVASVDDLEIGLLTLATTLLFNIKDPVQTFIALCNLLHRRLPYALIHDQCEDEYLQSQLSSFDKIFNKKLNRLSTHFKIYELSSIEFLKPMCSYCMTQYLDLSKASRMIDIYIFEGDSFLLRAVLGFLSTIDFKLFGDKSEIMEILGDYCLKNFNSNLVQQEVKTTELIYGYKYLDLGFDAEFFQCIRNILRD